MRCLSLLRCLLCFLSAVLTHLLLICSEGSSGRSRGFSVPILSLWIRRGAAPSLKTTCDVIQSPPSHDAIVITTSCITGQCAAEHRGSASCTAAKICTLGECAAVPDGTTRCKRVVLQVVIVWVSNCSRRPPTPAPPALCPRCSRQ